MAAQRVIVTAGADGLGRVIARSFLGLGAKVAICDVAADKVAAFAKEHPGTLALVADVGNAAAVTDFMGKAIAFLGGLDVLVNNAGIAGPTGLVEEVTPEALRQTLAIDLESMFYTLHHALPVMKQQKFGVVVNLSSTAGTNGYPYRSPYAAAKWGVIGLTKSLAMEGGTLGIRCNAICPGSLSGDRMDRVIAAEAKARGIAPEAVRAAYTKGVSTRSFIDPQEIADMVLYLASPAARNISGQAIHVDGHTETMVP